MKKEFEIISSDGKNAEYGTIVVTINSHIKKEKHNNPSTHEQDERPVQYHKVEAFREGEEKPVHSVEFQNKDAAPGHARAMEQRLKEHLKMKAEDHDRLDVIDQLELMGYE